MSALAAAAGVSGRILVTVVSASYLRNTKSFGSKQSVYVTIKVGKRIMKTKTAEGAGSEAEWNQELRPILRGESTIEVACLARTTIGSDTTIGKVTVPVADLHPTQDNSLTLDLTHVKSGKSTKAGQVVIVVNLGQGTNVTPAPAAALAAAAGAGAASVTPTPAGLDPETLRKQQQLAAMEAQLQAQEKALAEASAAQAARQQQQLDMQIRAAELKKRQLELEAMELAMKQASITKATLVATNNCPLQAQGAKRGVRVTGVKGEVVKIEWDIDGLHSPTSSDYLALCKQTEASSGTYVTYDYNSGAKTRGKMSLDASGYAERGTLYVVTYINAATWKPASNVPATAPFKFFGDDAVHNEAAAAAARQASGPSTIRVISCDPANASGMCPGGRLRVAFSVNIEVSSSDYIELADSDGNCCTYEYNAGEDSAGEMRIDLSGVSIDKGTTAVVSYVDQNSNKVCSCTLKW